MAVDDLTAELMGTFPTLPYLHSIQLLNRAWTRVRDLRLWSWQLAVDGQLFVPGMITAGRVSATYLSDVVTCDPTAAAALNAVFTVPFTGAEVGDARQIKIGAAQGVLAANGSNYTITGWDRIHTITLNMPFGEPSLVNAPYQIYQCYYNAPAYPPKPIPGNDPGFIRFLSLTNKTSGYTIRGKRLWYTQDMLNAIDPNRGATGDAYIVANYGHNSKGLPVFELYPAPATQATYSATYWTRWPDVTPTFDFPQVPYGLVNVVMDMARTFACQWATANVATKPELQLTNWIATAQFYKQEFKEGLIQCLKQDDEIAPLRGFSQTSKFDFPLGGEFLQGHDVSGLLARP